MASHIYHGVWINWSRGVISGATVTLGERDGGLLTAFIATFVTIVGAELWKIICYVSHQVRSKQEPQDGLYHQQQSILRNSPTPGGAAWIFLQQSWFWASKARLSFLRTLPWAIFSISYIVAIGLVAVFSSEISKSPGPLRLLIGDCGLWGANITSPFGQAAFTSKVTNETLVAASYAQACYGGSYDPLRCGRYRVPDLVWTINRNVTCPFPQDICSYESTAAAVNMTTKMIDSQDDLGINAPADARVKVQKTTVCAPLKRTGYYIAKNTTQPGVQPGRLGDTVIYYKYGNWYNEDGSILYNYTFIYNTHTPLDNVGYTVKSFLSTGGQGNFDEGWIPIDALNTNNSDLSLMYISGNAITYAAPVDDPIFSAHEPLQVQGLPTAYESDAAGGVLGCVEQYRICNPLNNVCTPFRGGYQNVQALSSNVDGMNLNLRQNATALRIATWFFTTSQYRATDTRSGNSLRASESLNEQSSPGLPNNQWQIEVSAWFDAGLATLQAGVQELAANTMNILPGSFLQRYDTQKSGIFYDFCVSQLVNDSAGTISFSILGLALLFILGGLIVFTSLTIDTIVGFIQQKTGKGVHARMEWLVNDKLQTHMMLLRELRLGQWSNGVIQRIPTTVGGVQKFGGPAQHELRVQGYTSSAEAETGVQLVQHEISENPDHKGWSHQ